jgi:peptidoglycan hydrolase-like protein with peptidoglycan-binding domain
MRQRLYKRSLRGLILAALTAGTWTVSAASAQDTVAQPKKPVHKGSSGATAAHSANVSTAKKSTHPSSGKASSRKKSTKVKGQAAPTPDRINEIQEALTRKGVFTGTPTGQWDDSTVEAMKKFQSSNGLNPSGKLDALTLEKLGLGSETAGLAAPTPPPNSANRLRNQSSAPAAEPSN